VPWARYEVDFVAEHFGDVAPADRPAAIALYIGLVDVSTKMLLDGRITSPTLHAVGDECGVFLGAKKGRERGKIARILIESGLLERGENGTYVLPRWREHHRSRHDVTEERKAAAERKRRSRGQMSLSMSRAESQRDVTGNVTAGQSRDSRAHAPAGAVTETKTETEDLDPEPLVGSDSSIPTKYVDVEALELAEPEEVLRGF